MRTRIRGKVTMAGVRDAEGLQFCLVAVGTRIQRDKLKVVPRVQTPEFELCETVEGKIGRNTRLVNHFTLHDTVNIKSPNLLSFVSFPFLPFDFAISISQTSTLARASHQSASSRQPLDNRKRNTSLLHPPADTQNAALPSPRTP